MGRCAVNRKPLLVSGMCSLKKVPLADVHSGSDKERQEQSELSADTIKEALCVQGSSESLGRSLTAG